MNSKPMALITGACGGIGRACCHRLGKSYRLVLTDRDQPQLDQLADELRSDGADVAAAIACDITNKTSIENLLHDAARLGTLTHLMHAAGVSPSMNMGWQSIFTINLSASQMLVETLLETISSGIVAVLVSSIAVKAAPKDMPALDALLDKPLDSGFLVGLEAIITSIDDQTSAQRFAYAASKYGVVRLVKRLTRAFAAKQGRIVSIAPGFINTPMGQLETQQGSPARAMLADIAMQRLGHPDEIATVVEFLFSDNASYVTGCDWAINGGIPH